MATISLAQRVQELFEPAARAARRGDADQISSVLRELRSIWQKARKAKVNTQVEELAKGMTFALEGVLGFVLASASSDARHALVEGRKHALSILHALGKKAREAHRTSSANRMGPDAAALRIGELANSVGVLPQNIGDLINAMSDCGLVRATDHGAARLVSITDIGAQVLDASKPGWQVLEVDHDPLSERVEQYTKLLAGQLGTMVRSRKTSELSSLHSHIERLFDRDMRRKHEIASFVEGYSTLAESDFDIPQIQRGHRGYRAVVRKSSGGSDYFIRSALIASRAKAENQT